MNTSEPTKNTTDEINLFDILTKIVLVIKSNGVMIAVTLITSTVLGWAYFQFSQKIYQSKMLLLTEPYGKSLIDNIGNLIEEKSTLTLSEKLGIPLEQASKIIAIEIANSAEKLSEKPEDTQLYINLEVKMKDNTSWSQIQNGLINYFRNNDFVKVREEQNKKYLKQIIDQINIELIDLEKLKTRITEGGLAQSSKESLVLFDPTAVNTKILDLNKEKINLQNSLETVGSIQVVEGFTVFKNPASPILSLSLAGGALFGLFIAFLIITFKGIRLILAQE